MKLSIITINYNNAEGLRKTLASVATQTYRNIEHIIVDGGSTDGSVDVIREYENTIKRSVTIEHPTIQVKWSSEPDKGIYNAMNKGIEIALGKRVVDTFNRSERSEDKNKGIEIAIGKRVVNSFNRSELVEDNHTSNIIHNTSENHTPYTIHHTPSLCDHYIQILNSGDLLAAPDVTERMMAALSSLNTKHSTLNKNAVSILYGNMIKEWSNGRRVKDTCRNELYTPESFLYFYNGTLNHDCAYIRRDLFDKYGLYNEQMKICSDWEWYVRAIALGGEKPVYMNIDVTIFDMTGISESGGKNAELIKKERREYLDSILPESVLRDYGNFSFPVLQYQRLKKYHLWGIVYFMERVLFKLEKWGIIR